MEIAKRCKVEVKKDHLTKVASGTAKTALAELIWNALDADATKIDVNFVLGSFGTEKVIVSDNGSGISYKDAESLFISLGGSWKASKQKTDKGRFLHGKEGQGRFKAFAIGRVVDWNITYQKNGDFFDYTLEGRSDSLDEFELSKESESEKNQSGVKVEINEIDNKFHVIQPDKALEM